MYCYRNYEVLPIAPSKCREGLLSDEKTPVEVFKESNSFWVETQKYGNE